MGLLAPVKGGDNVSGLSIVEHEKTEAFSVQGSSSVSLTLCLALGSEGLQNRCRVAISVASASVGVPWAGLTPDLVVTHLCRNL